MLLRAAILCCLVTATLAADGHKAKKKDARGKRSNLEYSISHHYPVQNYRLERRIATAQQQQPPRYPPFFPPGQRPRKGRPQSLPPPPYAVQMEPLVQYSQRDPLYDGKLLATVNQNDLQKGEDLLSENTQVSGGVYAAPRHVIERPVYIKEPEPIIEIIIKESNETLPAPPISATPPPKKKDDVQVFYVKYSKNPNANGKDSIIYEKPVPAISPEVKHIDEEVRPDFKEYVTPSPPPTTTLRAIIKPDSGIYHAPKGIRITFGPHKRIHALHDDVDEESAPQPAVSLPQGEFEGSRNFRPTQGEFEGPRNFRPPQGEFEGPRNFRPPQGEFEGPRNFRPPQPYRPFNQGPPLPPPTASGQVKEQYPQFGVKLPPQLQPLPQTRNPQFHPPPPPFRPHNRQPVPYTPFRQENPVHFPHTHFPIKQEQYYHPQQQFSEQQALRQQFSQQHLPSVQHRQPFNPDLVGRPNFPQVPPQYINQLQQQQQQQAAALREQQQHEQIKQQQILAQRQQQSFPQQQQPQANRHPQQQQLQENRHPQQQQQQLQENRHPQQQQQLQENRHPQQQQLQENRHPQQQQLQENRHPQQQFQENRNPQQQQLQENRHPQQQQFNGNLPQFVPPGGQLISSVPKYEQHITVGGEQALPLQNPQNQQIFNPKPDHFNQQLRNQQYQIQQQQLQRLQQQNDPFYIGTTHPPLTTPATTTFKPPVTTQKLPETTTKDATELSKQLPDEVPDDLREQLLSSGILNHAQISVLDYDKVGDIPLSALPPDQLANFYSAGGGQQIAAAGSHPIPSVAKPDEDMVGEGSEMDEVEMKVVRYNPETEDGQKIRDSYVQDDATKTDPVVLNDNTYNRYLPLKVNGAEFPLPDIPELKGKKISSVVVLAPVAYDFKEAARVTRDAQGRNEEEIKFPSGSVLQELIDKPTKENYLRFLERENKTSSDKQAVILLVTGNADAPKDEREIFMYDVATKTVSKLSGELSSAFVEAAEANSNSSGEAPASSNVVEIRVPSPVDEDKEKIGGAEVDLEDSASGIVESRIPIIDPMEIDLDPEPSEQLNSFVDVSGQDLTASDTKNSIESEARFEP